MRCALSRLRFPLAARVTDGRLSALADISAPMLTLCAEEGALFQVTEGLTDVHSFAGLHLPGAIARQQRSFGSGRDVSDKSALPTD